MKKLAVSGIALAALFTWIYLDKQHDSPRTENNSHTTIKDLLSMNGCSNNRVMQVCQDTTYCRTASAIRYCALEDYRDCYVWPVNKK